MLILNQKIKVKCVPTNIKHYKSKGYGNIKLFDEFEVDINDLQSGSHNKVDVVCDYCGRIYQKEYKSYVSSHEKSVTKKDCCYLCTKEKIHESVKEKYGADWYTQTDEFQGKYESSMLNKYGCKHALQVERFKKKAKETNFQRYGYEYASQSPEIKEKIKESNIERYGVDWYLQSDDKKEKQRETSRKKYGTDCPQQSDVVKQKMKNTMMQRYGVDNATKCPEILYKSMETLRKNDNAPSSTAQRLLCEYLNEILNYHIDNYFVDILMKEDNIIVEWDGSGHFLVVRNHLMSYEDFMNKETIRENNLIDKGYKIIRFISQKDKIYSKEEMVGIYNQLKFILYSDDINKITYTIN